MNKSIDLTNSSLKLDFGQNSETQSQPLFLTPENDQKAYLSQGLRGQNWEGSLDRKLVDAFLLGKSKRTRESYERITLECLSFLNPTSLEDVTLGSLTAFLELKNHQAHESKRLRLAVVKSFFAYGLRSGYLKSNVSSFLPKLEAHHKISERYLTQEEVIRMIALTPELRNQVILKVLYTAGLRLSELIALNWEHVQEREKGEGQLLILGKGNRKRVVVLSAGVFETLLKLKRDTANSIEPVFTSREWGSPRLSKRTIQILVDQARLRAGITKRVTPHWLRHAHASHALDRGAPIHLVQSTLGHASIATTGKYLHSRPQESSSKYLSI